jgi:hypothetical protein
MAKKQKTPSSTSPEAQAIPVVAATLAGVIYQARLLNRQSKLNIPEQEVISDVVNLWRIVKEALAEDEK